MSEHRTLMLEPQWHPIRWLRQTLIPWLDEYGFEIITSSILVGMVGGLVIAIPQPDALRLWPMWRLVLLGVCLFPIAALIMAIVVAVAIDIGKRISKGVLWCHRNPPFKIKTRWVSK